MKPFRREEHTPRLLDVALRTMNVRARRAVPRFAVSAALNAELRLPVSDGEDVFPVKNIAEGGATIDTETGGGKASLAPGGLVPLATLSWGQVQLEAELRVVHREENAGGVRFSRIYHDAPKLLRALEER